MRYRSFAMMAVLLSAIGAASSAVGASDLLIGKFTLSHPARWDNITLSSGEYIVKMDRTTSNARVLWIEGRKQAVQLMVYSGSECGSCKRSALNLITRGGRSVVTSLDLPGFHVDVNSRETAAEKEERLAKRGSPVEQIVVSLNDN